MCPSTAGLCNSLSVHVALAAHSFLGREEGCVPSAQKQGAGGGLLGVNLSVSLASRVILGKLPNAGDSEVA